MVIIQQSSNSIEICIEDFLGYQTTVSVSSCHDNATSEFISDDYYYVTINLAANVGDAWFITRLLHEPVDNESGFHILKNGSGGGVVKLGPFLIQDGPWDLTLHLDSCEFLHHIYPPDFCPECENFAKVKITDIKCYDPFNTPSDPTDDTWSFDIEITYTGSSDEYEILIGSTSLGDYDYNVKHTIYPGNITNGCITYKLFDPIDGCHIEITICPPKHCSSNTDCDLELYVKEYICDDGEFSVLIDVQNSFGANLCHRVQGATNFQGSLGSYLLGPYNGNIFLTVFLCSNPTCYKRIFIPYLDCDEDNIQGGSSSRTNVDRSEDDIRIIPNPITNGVINLESKLDFTEFAIFNIDNQMIYKGSFFGQIYRFHLDLKPGMYFLKYKNSIGNYSCLKFIKF